LISIVLFCIGERLLLPWLRKQSQASLIGFGFAISIIMIMIGKLVIALIASSPDPTAWAQFSTETRSSTHYFSLAGAFFGALAGFVLMLGSARFKVKSTWWQRSACYLLGIASLLLIYFGLDMLFGLIAIDESVLGYVLRYVRYGTVSFWVTFGAPWTFLKIGLADPVTERIKPTIVMEQSPS
jgi:hypothetical protein